MHWKIEMQENTYPIRISMLLRSTVEDRGYDTQHRTIDLEI